jgi:predicted glycoside hydrolase/deacetylase ChbG (UPF0249 family)
VTAGRFLIVNADDFGLSAEINRGIIQTHEQGIVTSASLMVRQPGAGAAAEYARRHPSLSVGLHLDLGEWSFTDGGWESMYEVVPLHDRQAVATETERQLARFQELLGRAPSHLDSHQHVHRDEPARTAALAAADRLRVPLRHVSESVAYVGSFYGQAAKGGAFPEAISVANLIDLIEALPAGVTELGCHPGLDPHLASMYRAERAIEVATLCDARVRKAIAASGLTLVSFHDLRRMELRF